MGSTEITMEEGSYLGDGNGSDQRCKLYLA